MGIFAGAAAGAEGGGFGAMVALAGEIGGKLDKANGSLDAMAKAARPNARPIRTTVWGTAKADGSSPFLVAVNGNPAAGRKWNIRTAAVYGNDAHTPVVGTPTLTASGSVTSPGAGATIASISSVALLAAAPAGTLWIVQWTVGLDGTLAAADRNNFQLTSPLGTQIERSVNPIVAGTYPQPTVDMITGNGGTAGINVQAIGGGTVGAVYSADITATPAEGAGCLAEFYAGDLPDAGGTTFPITGLLPDNFGPEVSPPAQIIPYYFEPAKEAVWCGHGEGIYALAYDVPSGQQLVIVCNVDDWKVEDVEALHQ